MAADGPVSWRAQIAWPGWQEKNSKSNFIIINILAILLQTTKMKFGASGGPLGGQPRRPQTSHGAGLVRRHLA